MNTVNTINDLRNLAGVPGDSVILLGYYTKGDKAPIYYIYNSGNFVDNGGDIIIPIGTINGAWVAPSLNSVEDHGMVGNNPAQIDSNFLIFKKLVENNKDIILLDKTYYIGTNDFIFSNIQEIRIFGKNPNKHSQLTNIVTLNKNFFISNSGCRIISVGVRYWGNINDNFNVTASIFEYVGNNQNVDFSLIMRHGGIFFSRKGFYTTSYATGCNIEDVKSQFNEYFFFAERESNTTKINNTHVFNNRVGIWGYGYQFIISEIELSILCHQSIPDSSNTGERIGIYCPQGHIDKVYIEEYVNFEPITEKHKYIWKNCRNAEIDTLNLNYIDFNTSETSHYDLYMTSEFLSTIEQNTNLINIIAENERQVPKRIGAHNNKIPLGININNKSRYYIKNKVLFNHLRHHKILFPLTNGFNSIFSHDNINCQTFNIKPDNIEGIELLPNSLTGAPNNYYYAFNQPLLNPNFNLKVIYNFQIPVDIPGNTYCLVLRFANNLKRIDFSQAILLPNGTNCVIFKGEAYFNSNELTNISEFFANLGFDSDFNIPSDQNLADANGYFEIFNLP